jgi:enterochelin esterase-like enzyme
MKQPNVLEHFSAWRSGIRSPLPVFRERGERFKRHINLGNALSIAKSLCVCVAILIVGCAEVAEKKEPKTFLASPQFDKSNVKFNLQADRMTDVEIVGEWSGWKHESLLRNDKGTWTITVNDMPPGIWHYFFLVNGLEINDALNPIMQPSRELNASIVQVPSSPPAPWDPQNIPHGVLHTHQYFSTALGRDRQVIVYTPPGYSASSPPLPVLYLAQGFGGTEQSWTVEGKAHWIADEMIAEKTAVPMIIVMPNAHAIPYTGQHIWPYLPPNTDAFIRELREDVRPLVESNYNVRTDGDSRAFAGLSMGGCEAYTLGLNHPDEFTWIAALSPASVPLAKIQSALDNPAAVNAKLHLFWVPVGDWDSPDEARKFVEKLRAAGLKPEFEIVHGDHSWPVWRHDLVKLLPRLFR